MTTALQTSDSTLVPADVAPMDLQAALAGDLRRLTPEGRLKYYGALCNLTGLNPLSKPFDWLELQGRLVLYANKGCAEQLRKLHGVSLEIVERKVEFGCIIVRVKATDSAGRVDEAVGAVPFVERNPADAANAIMKCETKAKRRVSLSICGLGLLDESELDTVRERPAVVADAERSAAAIADALNSSLTVGEKEKAVEVVVEAPAAPTAEPTTEPPTPAPSPFTEATPTPPDPLSVAINEFDDRRFPAYSRNEAVAFLLQKNRIQQGDSPLKMGSEQRDWVLKDPPRFHKLVSDWVAGGRK